MNYLSYMISITFNIQVHKTLIYKRVRLRRLADQPTLPRIWLTRVAGYAR